MNEARKFLSQKSPLKLPAGNASCGDPRVLNWGQEELAGSGLSQASSSILFPLQVLKRLSCCLSVDTRNKVPMSCKRVPPGDWWLSDQRSAPRNIKAEVRPVRAAAGLSPCLPTVGKMPCTKTLPGSSCPKERLFTSLSLQAPPPAPQKGGLPTSAAGQYICDGLQGWPWLRLIPDVDPSGMCLLSNCPASEGSHRPPSARPCLCCTPARACSTWRPSSFPTACAGTATAGTRASPVGGRTLLQPGPWSWGAGGLSPSPFFFSGSRHWGWGQREKLWKTH